MAKTDGYEDEYMSGGGGEVLHRDRTVWRLGVPVLGIPAIGSLAAAAAIFATLPGTEAAFGLIPLLSGALIGACALLLTVLRVVVSTKEVHVQYGPFGPRIPIAAIERAEAIDYDWKQYGGWGVRVGLDGSRAYSVMSGQGRRAVRIRWKDGDAEQVTVVTSTDPEAIVAAIAEARARAGLSDGAALARPAAKVRVTAEDGASSASTSENAEAEAQPGRGLTKDRSC